MASWGRLSHRLYRAMAKMEDLGRYEEAEGIEAAWWDWWNRQCWKYAAK